MYHPIIAPSRHLNSVIAAKLPGMMVGPVKNNDVQENWLNNVYHQIASASDIEPQFCITMTGPTLSFKWTRKQFLYKKPHFHCLKKFRKRHVAYFSLYVAKHLRIIYITRRMRDVLDNCIYGNY